MKKYLLLSLGILAALVAIGYSTPAGAVVGPDSPPGSPAVRPGGLYGATPPAAKASYVVSKDGFTDIRRTQIKVYVPVSAGSIVVNLRNANMCMNASLGTSNSFDQTFLGAPATASGLATSYNISGGAGSTVSPSSVAGNWSSAASCNTASTAITLSNGAIDTRVNMRVYRIDALANQATPKRFVNLFWLETAVPGVVFSQDVTGGSQDFGYQLSAPIPPTANRPGSSPPSQSNVYYNTQLLFGADCSVTGANTPALIELYDDDNTGANDDVQPSSFSVRLVESNRDGTGSRSISLSRAAGSSAGSTLTLSDATNRIYIPRSNTEKGTINLGFLAQPNKIYRLYFGGIYYNNTLQFALPYETVYGYVGCKSSSLQGFTSQPATTIVPGQSATWNHTLTNTSAVGTADGVVAEMHQSVRGSDGVMISGDRVVGSRLINNASMAPGARVAGSDTFNATADDVGRTICEWLAWTSTTTAGGRTTQTCTVVGKTPKLQIWGGDARVGGAVDTSSAGITGRTYGSWVEYGAFIGGVNRGNRFGSGASLAGGPTSLGTRQGNDLTFANVGVGSEYGRYGTVTSQNQILATYMANLNIGGTGTPITGTVDLGARATGRYTASGNLTLHGSVGPGRTIIIDARGRDVTIDQNITYSGAPYANIDQIPQVIILARNININDSVQTVDAWLVATNTTGPTALLNTCANQTNISISICNAKLTVNGPVAVDQALFKRTAGSDDAARAGDPAELLNLRADAYLWEYAQARRNATPLTVKVTELPPRY